MRRNLTPLLAALLLACSSPAQPDLGRLYRGWAARDEGRRPVVVMHGIMGARLVDRRTGELVWGGLAGMLGGGGDVAARLALPLDPKRRSDLEPAGFVESVGGTDIYGSLLNTLEEHGGYLRASRQRQPYRRATCFPFFYDWRESNARSAARLAARIEEIRGLYRDPTLKVDIVAHSMGGLVARYYLLYGARDVRGDPAPHPDLAGARTVGKLVLLGTPNLGSAGALRACVEGDRIGLTPLEPEALATMPSMYELMPAQGQDTLLLSDRSPAPLDIYEVATWRRQGWGVFAPRFQAGIRARFLARHPRAGQARFGRHLGRLRARFGRLLALGRGFHRALDAAPLPASVETILLGGDCLPTERAFLVEREGGALRIRFRPDEVLRPPPGADLDLLYFEPGDGTVTKTSLLAVRPGGPAGRPHSLLPAARAIFVCEGHRALVRNRTLQDNLLHALLYRPLTAAEACAVR